MIGATAPCERLRLPATAPLQTYTSEVGVVIVNAQHANQLRHNLQHTVELFFHLSQYWMWRKVDDDDDDRYDDDNDNDGDDVADKDADHNDGG